ncbi:MAG: Vms1/Ankzf1 family peptidyl-tRNA hydrolase [Ornithinibacter sp.]
MHLPDLTALTSAEPPFTSVALDVTHTDPATTDDVERRWRRQADSLLEQGAPAELVDLLGETLTEPTGLSGERTRVVVATDRVLLDQVLPGRPVRDEACVGRIPLLMPLLRAWARFVPHAVVRLDRAGADIDVLSTPDAPPRHLERDGGHDVMHQFGGGGWSQRRFQSRVEDSWQHNAGAVADALARVQHDLHPQLVLVGGDDKAWGQLRGQVSEPVAGRLVRLTTGGRADGVSTQAEEEAVRHELEQWRVDRREELFETYREERTKARRVAEGLSAVVTALQRGQVETLVLRDDPTSTAQLWVGRSPLALGEAADDVAESAGRAEPLLVRADLALPWALVGSGAGLVLVEDDDDVELVDGVGALLRWSDESTPHQPGE